MEAEMGMKFLIMASLCLLAVGQNLRNSHNSKDAGTELDIRELARQNRITQAILQNYLERRLFPGLNRTSRVPTITEILPSDVSIRKRPSAVYHERYRHEIDENSQDGGEEASVEDGEFYGDTESLQSVESEQVSAYYNEGCDNCVEEANQIPNRWTMPLLKSGEKRYYLGIFFRANWFRAQQYCRFHGMHLASISSQEENDKLEKHIKDFGLGHEHFWTSGTDLAEEGSFFWMASGRPITFTNWNAGEPNNFRYENGEEENCMELWNRDGKGLKWNDSPCSFETFFVCEVQ